MLYVFSKWCFVLFSWGGFGIAIWWMVTLKKSDRVLEVTPTELRSALSFLLAFVVLATFGFLDLFRMTFGGIWLQVINNALAGVLFISFLLRLKQSIRMN